MPRLPAVTANSEFSPEQRGAAEAVLKVFGHIRGPFSMLLHSPKLAEQLLPLVTFVRETNIVEPRLRFVAILTAVRESAADYVWAAQVEQARKNGIREEVIELIRAGEEPARFAPDEREILLYVRQLLRAKRVEQAVFEMLARKYSAQWLVELTTIVNFFVLVSGICNAFEVEPPTGGATLRREV
jgi:4-carboxymuconolactone decarboxylase